MWCADVATDLHMAEADGAMAISQPKVMDVLAQLKYKNLLEGLNAEQEHMDSQLTWWQRWVWVWGGWVVNGGGGCLNVPGEKGE